MVGEHTYFEINPHGLSPKELDVRLEGEPRNNFYFANIFKSVFYKKPAFKKSTSVNAIDVVIVFSPLREMVCSVVTCFTEALSVSNRASERFYACGHLIKKFVSYCITT